MGRFLGFAFSSVSPRLRGSTHRSDNPYPWIVAFRAGLTYRGKFRFPLARPVEPLLQFPTHVALVFGLMAIGFGVGPLLLARLWAYRFSPSKPGLEKNANYECGLASKGDPGGQQSVHYYLYAIVFLVFDVESIFLIPFAAAYSGLSLGAVIAMGVFLLLLAEGLVWAWLKGVLTWR